MAGRQVQSVAASFGNSSSARTLAYGSAVTAGNLLVLGVATFNDVTVTVSDSVNGNWTQAGGYAGPSASNKVSIWYFENSGAGTPTITITPSATAFTAFWAVELSGMLTSGALDSTVTNTGTSANFTTGTLTAGAAGRWCMGVFGIGTSFTSALGTGATNLGYTNGGVGSVEQSVFAHSMLDANAALTVTMNTSFSYAGIGASFKATADAGGGTAGSRLVGPSALFTPGGN